MSRSLVSQGLLFSHIPKTAGTSFRKSASGLFSGLHVIADYERQNRITSDFIRQLYASGDFSRITEIDTQRTLLAGHFPITKYLRYYPVVNVITFLREPLQRVISHYHDLQKRISYPGSLLDFAREPQFCNVQFRFLDGVPVEALGFVGLSEQYRESIDMINRQYGLRLRVKHVNQNRNKPDATYRIDEAAAAEIRDLNRDDYQLYEKALRLFDTRMALMASEQPYVYGRLDSINEGQVSGWAVDPYNDVAVEVELRVNGQPAGRMSADSPVPALDGMNMGRHGAIGFSFRSEYAPGDTVEVVVAATGQRIL